jgi:hypothetical protein
MTVESRPRVAARKCTHSCSKPALLKDSKQELGRMHAPCGLLKQQDSVRRRHVKLQGEKGSAKQQPFQSAHQELPVSSGSCCARARTAASKSRARLRRAGGRPKASSTDQKSKSSSDQTHYMTVHGTCGSMESTSGYSQLKNAV